MNDLSNLFKLPEQQEAIRARCFHPTGEFIEFKPDEVEQSIQDRFEKIVRIYPDQIAVKMAGRSVSYDQLNRAANRVARAILADRGECSEPVALLFEHGIDVIVAILGVLKAGKFYVAMDPSFPRERITQILEDSGAGLIVTNDRNRGLGNKLKNEGCALVNANEIDDSSESGNLNIPILGQDLASVIFTSGSTGEPKGLLWTHGNRVNSFFTHSHETRISTGDRLALLHSASFASGNGDLFSALLAGAALLPFDVKTEGVHRLITWLKKQEITFLHLPPTLLRQIADSLSGEKILTSLRLVHLSGAPITQLDFELYKGNFSSSTLLEISMGSTETRGICSAILDQTFSFPKEGAPVGYPRPGKKVLLLDEEGNEVGPGEVGEVAVKSRNLTLGYWRQPGISSAKFLPDLSGGDERTYATGDLGWMLPDGFLILLGRKDNQVKIRGYRVEFSEIERALLAHPGIREVTIVARDRANGDKFLVAYVVPHQPPAPKLNELYRFLKEKLPDYMMPSTLVFLDCLPLTNGKLNRAALPDPGTSRPALDTPLTFPRNLTEDQLTNIWGEVLGIDQVGVHDNFFDLGGHSLAATRVVSQVIKTFQLELPLQALFQAPTVAEMAAVIAVHQAKNLGEKDLARMIDELESLSDEEAQRLLADANRSTGNADRHE